MLSVSYHDTVNVLQGTIEKSRAQNAGPFERFEWLDLLVKSGAEPLVVIATDGQDRSVLPLKWQGDTLESLTNWYNFTWTPLGAGNHRLLAEAAAGLREKTHRVVMSPVPGEDDVTIADDLVKAFRTAGWIVQKSHCDHNHVLYLYGQSFEEYWAARPGRMRTTVKRKAKKVDVEILTEFDDNVWQEYETVYANSWKPEEGDPDLLRAFARQEGEAGRIRLAVARHQGKAVAAQFWTVEDGIAYIHKLSHLEEHKVLSAGTTLSAALFERVIDIDKVRMIDFGTGDDPYKRDWMVEDRERYRIDCLDPRQPKAWPALAKRAIRRLAPAARQS